MENIKVFERLVKSLPEDHQMRLPEKIRQVVNRSEHTDFLKAIVLGAYLSLEYEISLRGYIEGDLLFKPEEISRLDGTHATAIRNDHTDKMIIGVDDE
jgi:hypothetical protein